MILYRTIHPKPGKLEAYNDIIWRLRQTDTAIAFLSSFFFEIFVLKYENVYSITLHNVETTQKPVLTLTTFVKNIETNGVKHIYN